MQYTWVLQDEGPREAVENTELGQTLDNKRNFKDDGTWEELLTLSLNHQKFLLYTVRVNKTIFCCFFMKSFHNSGIDSSGQ